MSLAKPVLFTNTLTAYRERLRFTILRIYPSDELPSLQQIAELDLPQLFGVLGLSFCSLSGNKVIFLLGSTLNVWDYAEDAWASIRVPSDYEQVRLPIDNVETIFPNIAQIMVTESAILLPYPTRILIWKMPPLSTSKPLFSGSPPSTTHPAFTLKIPSSQIDVSDCRGPCDWYSGSPQPLLFDFLYDDSRIQRFEVEHKNENFNDSVVTTLGIYPDRYHAFESCRFCNDSLVSWWVRAGTSEAHVATLPSTADSHPPDPINSTIPLFVCLENNFTCSLCPFSGRFAYDLDCVNLKVVDYFSESLPIVRFFFFRKNHPTNISLLTTVRLSETTNTSARSD